MEPSARTKPPAFPMPPKSALFSRLEAFLPVLASENEKLEAAIASGEGDRHNIEIQEPDAAMAAEGDGESDSEEEDEDEDSDVEMDGAKETKQKKAPVIEMNFALGLMEEGGSDDDSSDEEDEKEEIDLAASIAAAHQPSASAEQADGSSALQLPNTKAGKQPTRPLIQELN